MEAQSSRLDPSSSCCPGNTFCCRSGVKAAAVTEAQRRGESIVEGWGPRHGLPGWCALGGPLRFPPVAWRVLSSSVAACGVVLGLLQPSSVLSPPEQCLGHSWTMRNAPLCLGYVIHCCAGNACMQFLAHAWARVPGLWAPPPGAVSRSSRPGSAWSLPLQGPRVKE